MLAFTGLLAVQQRGQDVGVRVHAGGDVGDGRAGLGRRVFGPGDRDETGLALDQQVVSLLVAVGSTVAITRDVADDDAGLGGAQDFVRKAQASGGTGR